MSGLPIFRTLSFRAERSKCSRESSKDVSIPSNGLMRGSESHLFCWASFSASDPKIMKSPNANTPSRSARSMTRRSALSAQPFEPWYIGRSTLVNAAASGSAADSK